MTVNDDKAGKSGLSNDNIEMRSGGKEIVEDKDPEPRDCRGIMKAWPIVTFCVIGNEFCERFSFYGMRTILTYYLINILKFGDSQAKYTFHAFIVLAYTSPFFGSIIADGFIGKFWTIFTISLVYATGQIMLATAAVFATGASVHPWLDIAGLIVIAIGTGGIKPCVVAFGADQFKPHYATMLSIYFSIFYFSINAGSMISSIATPIIRSTPCMGADNCYVLAFGIPALLMIVATVIFMLGSFSYKKIPPRENVIVRFIRTIVIALRNYVRSKKRDRQHIVDYYLDTHSCAGDSRCQLESKENCAQKKFCHDVQSVLSVCVMFLPVPMFWALYDQQGSAWTIQAGQMNSEIFFGWHLLPELMQVVNAILIMMFIPIFQLGIYPLVERFGIKATPLRRMSLGGLLAAAAFVICGFVQLAVNQTLPEIPAPEQVQLSFVNAYTDCNYVVTDLHGRSERLLANTSLTDDLVKNEKRLFRYGINERPTFDLQFESVNGKTEGCFGLPKVGNFNLGDVHYTAENLLLNATGGQGYYTVTSKAGIFTNEANFDKPNDGKGLFSMTLNTIIPCSSLPDAVRQWNTSGCLEDNSTYSGPIAFCKIMAGDANNSCNPRKNNVDFYAWQQTTDGEISRQMTTSNIGVTIYRHKNVKPQAYQAYFMLQNPIVPGQLAPEANEITVVPIKGVAFENTGEGGVYAMIVTEKDQPEQDYQFTVHTIVYQNQVNILWQLPQYFVITFAEILISITGLEFAYSQAAPSMKSVVQAIWLFTVALGDLIIIVITSIEWVFHEHLEIEMFVYAALMVVVMLIFILLAIFYYEYADYSHQSNGELAERKTTDTNSTETEE